MSKVQTICFTSEVRTPFWEQTQILLKHFPIVCQKTSGKVPGQSAPSLISIHIQYLLAICPFSYYFNIILIIFIREIKQQFLTKTMSRIYIKKGLWQAPGRKTGQPSRKKTLLELSRHAKGGRALGSPPAKRGQGNLGEVKPPQPPIWAQAKPVSPKSIRHNLESKGYPPGTPESTQIENALSPCY